MRVSGFRGCQKVSGGHNKVQPINVHGLGIAVWRLQCGVQGMEKHAERNISSVLQVRLRHPWIVFPGEIPH